MAYSSIPGALIVRACLCLAIVISGLALRRFGFGLGWPAIIVKYGGSMLWGAMVFFLVVMLLGRIFSAWDILAYGAGIGFAMGLDRLVAKALMKEPPAPHSAS